MKTFPGEKKINNLKKRPLILAPETNAPIHIKILIYRMSNSQLLVGSITAVKDRYGFLSADPVPPTHVHYGCDLGRIFFHFTSLVSAREVVKVGDVVKFHVVESRKGSPEGKQVTVVGSGNVAGGNVNEAVRGKRFRGVLRWGSQQGDVMLAIQGEKPWGKIAVLDITSQRFNRTACGRALGALYRGGELEFGVAWDGKRVIAENVKVRGEKCALAAPRAMMRQ